MTKLEELKAALEADAVIAVFEAARAAGEADVAAEYNDPAAARAAWAAIWAPFQAELDKIQKENSND
jgi:hypothetical protein